MIPEYEMGWNALWDLKDSDYVMNSNPNQYVGVGGVRTFVFECREPGAETLSLVYARPWLIEDAMDQIRYDIAHGEMMANVAGALEAEDFVQIELQIHAE